MRRRDFITTTLIASGLATSGLTLPAVHVNASQAAGEGEGDELQLALIGVGYQGRVLLNAARQIPNVRFRALCDMWNYARNYGQSYLSRYAQDVTTYADYREMLDKESSLDAVLIASPDFAHAPQAIACLEKGLHVYCEPMLAHSLPAVRSILQTVSRTGKLLQVGFQRRSNPRYQHVQQRLMQEAQLTGQLNAVQTQWAQEASELRGWPRRFLISDKELRQFGYQDMSQFRNWMWHAQYSGGPFCDYVAHQLDVCQWLLDAKPQAVLASGSNDLYSDRPHLDTVMSVFEFPHPESAGTPHPLRVSCNMFTGSSAGGMRQFERFLGTEGSIQISENPRWTRIGREAKAGDWDQWVRKAYLEKPEIESAFSAEDDALEVHVSGELEQFQLPPLQMESNCTPHLANFCAAVRGQAELACPADVAWSSHVAAFKALEAVQARKTLELGPQDYQV